MAILSLVGKQMRHLVGIAGRMFTTLGQGNVNIEMISQGANEINISCVIDGRDAISGDAGTVVFCGSPTSRRTSASESMNRSSSRSSFQRKCCSRMDAIGGCDATHQVSDPGCARVCAEGGADAP